MSRERRIVLGPCQCHACGVRLYWDGYFWKDWIFRRRHVCKP